MIVMLSHGLVSGALFLCVGVIYDRLHTREIARYGGLAINMPRYACCSCCSRWRRSACRARAGFVGEFLSLAGTYQVSTWIALVCTTGIILGAAYMLYLYRRVVFGEIVHDDVRAMPDLSHARARAARADRGGRAVDGRLSRKLPGADARRRRRCCSRGSTAPSPPVTRCRPPASPPPPGTPRLQRTGRRTDGLRHDLLLTLPELVLTVGALALMLVAAWGGQASTRAVSAGPRSRCWPARRSRWSARRRPAAMRSTACTAPTPSRPSPRC